MMQYQQECTIISQSIVIFTARLLYWIAYYVRTLYATYPITFKIGYLILLPQYVRLNFRYNLV